MTRSKKLLIFLVIPTTVMLVLVSLLIGMAPRQFLWLRSIAGIWTLTYVIYLQCRTSGYKGISSILVFVLLAAMLILGLWLVPFEIISQSSLLVVGALTVAAVYWNEIRGSLSKDT